MDTRSLQSQFMKVRSNKKFEMFVIFVIVFSALMVGAKTYDIPQHFLTLIAWLDMAITIIFLIEITVRFLGEEHKTRFFHDAWNVFDTVIVLVSLIPIEDSELAFVGRLVRVFRVLRMISVIPELRVLINSLIRALPELGYVLLLMFIIFYIYGAVGSMFFANINPTLWGDISISLLTLFRVMTFEDWTDIMYETMVVYPLSWVYYLTFIFFTAFAFLNMVIGIVVNNLEIENARRRHEDLHEPDITDVYKEIQELKKLIKEK